MRIMLLGAPGAGKGTHAKFIMDKYSIPQISTGNILRTAVDAQSELGKQAKVLMDAGKLINDELMIALVTERIKQNYYRNGFVLEGFPRTMAQAYALKEAGIVMDYVLFFEIPDSIIIERIVGRRVHVPSGRIYHVKFNPPKQEGKDDITGEPLTTRTDDKKYTLHKRLMEYYQQTVPLIDYYHQEADKGKIRYYQLDSTRNVNDISAELTAILEHDN
ncbi:Adenylate kinase [Candidatus Moranella endobia PCVAL]|uniref:Adenylate kinase n=1 Tax=Moranella endobia (strain PCIT) TaxID=903503 RepID=F7XX96_MOREP|nr:adenylate kinase [Candidatus Moranella endobia]AEI74722.1 adenylate kinase [Candidatus Moranella endobia PCIT]AGJ61378.1 Adenylate kinase [Candidatus Moranella endobia PCVAL]